MKTLWRIVVLVALAHQVMSLAIEKAAEKKKMVCYYGSWAVYRPGNGKFDVENIDPFICTHIVYGFAGLGSDNTIKPLDPYNDLYENWGKGAFLRFTGLKKKNPELKALIAIGGWNEGSEKYSLMASDPAKRAIFVNSVVNFLITYNFDGFDFDWEYPGNRGGAIIDKINFVLLLRELKSAFAPYGFLLTAAVSPGKSAIDSAYDIPAVASALDQIHLMAYDYHGSWETYTGLNAPLYANPSVESGSNLLLNVNWTVNYWISNGAPASKIILGMGLYGRGFTLASPTQNGFYAYAPQPITAGPYTRESGTWGYNEICEKFKADPSWTVVRDSSYLTPYAFKSSQWIGYDDQQSLTIKAQYASSMNLGGAMVWSMETDDFRGLCHNVPFILIKTIYESMNGPIVTPSPVTTTSTLSTTTKATITTTTTPRTTTTTTTPVTTTTTKITSSPSTPSTTTQGTTICGPTSSITTTKSPSIYTTLPPITTTAGAPPPNTLCKSEGLNPDPNDCGIFYTCINNGQGGWTIYTQRCANGTAFSDALNTCTYPNQVLGCENYTG
ncbi:acidic mammalian chitinase-like [Daphnia pulex]|uniref:acidic mammalian chitinase-like n=1 Tax=Daphnia pulex TaxID=6669 RepID=UPI001EDE5DDB|nr:acidic mammalian chitinase-like [Daphnia pulex]